MNDPTGREYLAHIHRMRAVAIVLIVAGHCLGFFAWTRHEELRDALEDLVENGTVVFVFISGYLFQHLAGRFRYPSYLLRKLRYVLLPYLILSVPAIVHAVYLHDAPAQYSMLQGTSTTYQVFWFYLHGGTRLVYAYWFIPMILVYFLAAPLFIQFVRRPAVYVVLLGLIPLSLLLHRPAAWNPDLIHAAVYYLSAYVAGMAASQFRERIDPLVDRYLVGLTFLFAGYYVVHLLWSSHHGNYHVQHPFDTANGYIDWLYLQKLLLSVVLLGWLRRSDGSRLPWIDRVGHASFSIYFLHAYVIYGMHWLIRWRPVAGGVTKWLVLTTIVVGASLLVTRGVQRLLGKNSRILVGS